MTKDPTPAPTVRLNLASIDQSLRSVEQNWSRIDDELERHHIGRKDPFSTTIRERMVSGYRYLDRLLAAGMVPFSDESLPHLLELNHHVHYGDDQWLRVEYVKALEATAEKFYRYIDPLRRWYQKHRDRPQKAAAEIYVSILGRPQLFIEGNHRSGALIASQINLYDALPPFVLSPENALAYFAPSAEIKRFANRTNWRGRRTLPKYRKSFLAFWEKHTEHKYLL